MDPVLSRTRVVAAEVLRQVARVRPASAQLAELDRVLASYDLALPATVRTVANGLRARGMTVKAAAHEALARGLADSFILKIQQMGARAAAGDRAAQLGGLGTDAGTIAVDMTRGLVCSAEVQRAITDLVGRSQGTTGASLTELGFAVGQLAAQCRPAGPGAAPPPPPPPPPKPSLAVPLAIAGASVLVVGAIAYAARAK